LKSRIHKGTSSKDEKRTRWPGGWEKPAKKHRGDRDGTYSKREKSIQRERPPLAEEKNQVPWLDGGRGFVRHPANQNQATRSGEEIERLRRRGMVAWVAQTKGRCTKSGKSQGRKCTKGNDRGEARSTRIERSPRVKTREKKRTEGY